MFWVEGGIYTWGTDASGGIGKICLDWGILIYPLSFLRLYIRFFSEYLIRISACPFVAISSNIMLREIGHPPE